MKTRRLKALANLLDTLDPNTFELTIYGNRVNPHKKKFKGCAAGHATKLFASKGFRLKKGRYRRRTVLVYKSHTGMDACIKFFDISFSQAFYVFYNMASDVTPIQVAERIRSLINTPQSEPVP